jgi:hypothetical protein
MGSGRVKHTASGRNPSEVLSWETPSPETAPACDSSKEIASRSSLLQERKPRELPTPTTLNMLYRFPPLAGTRFTRPEDPACLAEALAEAGYPVRLPSQAACLMLLLKAEVASGSAFFVTGSMTTP